METWISLTITKVRPNVRFGCNTLSTINKKDGLVTQSLAHP